MAASSLWLLLLSVCMFLGSFLAGNIPLALQFSEDKLQMLSTFGSGLLVGTAFIVILPEGVETLFAVQELAAQAELDDLDTIPKAIVEEHKAAPVVPVPAPAHDHDHDHPRPEEQMDPHARPHMYHPRDEGDHDSLEHAMHPPHNAPNQLEEPPKAGKAESKGDGHDHHEHTFEAAGYIGPSLVLGFLFMLLLDQCGPSHGHAHEHVHVSVADLKDGLPPPSTDKAGNTASQRRMAATIGLVVHAAADGIAMGAASASDQASLEFIVFMAIMLHKAPSAFGLATHLMHEGNSRRTIRQHLMAFSLAAPIAAMLTFWGLSTTGWDDPIGMRKWTGLLLLFSAGTFIYVATMHILPEIILNQPPPSKEPVASSDRLHSPSRKQDKGDGRLSWPQLAALVVGMFAPYVLMVKVSRKTIK
ncbi:hypothetical protein HDU96_004651 [Phlyctochytrium bullatum]|nr:hypothetical protein HDU96_004651 [Phlyctochytrium bullatum]